MRQAAIVGAIVVGAVLGCAPSKDTSPVTVERPGEAPAGTTATTVPLRSIDDDACSLVDLAEFESLFGEVDTTKRMGDGLAGNNSFTSGCEHQTGVFVVNWGYNDYWTSIANIRESHSGIEDWVEVPGFGDAALMAPGTDLRTGLREHGWFIVLPGGRGGMDVKIYAPPAADVTAPAETIRNLVFDRMMAVVPEGGHHDPA